MLRSAAVLLLCAAACFAQPCAPPPAVQSALDELDLQAGAPAASARIWRDGLARLRAQDPGGFHIAYQEIRRLRSTSFPRIRDEVEARYRTGAAGPLSRLLEAFAWIGDDTPKAISMFQALKQEHPEMVWADFGLAFIHTYPAFRKPDLAAAHLLGFIRACPGALEAYELLPRIEAGEHAASLAATFRAQLAGRRTAQALRLWPTLWSLEFKASLPDARERVAADVSQIEQWAPRGFDALRLRTQAARLTGDPDRAKALEAELQKLAKDREMTPAMRALNEWLSKNPAPPQWQPAARAAWARRCLDFIGLLPGAASGGYFVLATRAQRIAEIPERPAAEVRAAAEQSLAELDPEQAGLSPSNYYRIATAYLERPELRPLVPAVLDAARDLSPPGYRASDLLPQSRDDEAVIHRSARLARAEALLYRAELAALEGETAISERHLAEYARALDAERTPPGQPVLRGDPLPHYEMLLYETRARIALRAGEPRAAALWMRRSAFAFTPPRTALIERAHELWRHAGGSESEWEALEPAPGQRPKPRVETDPRERAPNQPFPDFSFADTAGRGWSLASLRGKPVFINIWATWCGPCLLELPHLEQLHRDLAKSGEAVVLTLNIDDNPGLIEPFILEKGYTFPVIHASIWVEQHLPGAGIPRNLIINAAGRWVKDYTGFSGSGPAWIARMKSALLD